MTRREIKTEVDFSNPAPDGEYQSLDISSNAERLTLSIHVPADSPGTPEYVIEDVDEIRDLIKVLENYRDYRVHLQKRANEVWLEGRQGRRAGPAFNAGN